MTYRIIQVDNFAREGPGHDDRVIFAGIQECQKGMAIDIVAGLNALCQGDHDPRHFRLVDQDYKLQRFEP